MLSDEIVVGSTVIAALGLDHWYRDPDLKRKILRDVAPNGGDVLADVPDRLIELRLAAAGDEDVGALGNELPVGGQAVAAAAPGDDRDFPFQFLRHGITHLPVRAVRVAGYEYVRPPHHTLTTTLPICWFDSR